MLSRSCWQQGSRICYYYYGLGPVQDWCRRDPLRSTWCKPGRHSRAGRRRSALPTMPEKTRACVSGCQSKFAAFRMPATFRGVRAGSFAQHCWQSAAHGGCQGGAANSGMPRELTPRKHLWAAAILLHAQDGAVRVHAGAVAAGAVCVCVQMCIRFPEAQSCRPGRVPSLRCAACCAEQARP